MQARSSVAFAACIWQLALAVTLLAQQPGDRLFVIEAPHCLGAHMDGTEVAIPRGELLTLEEVVPNYLATRWQGHYTLLKPSAVLSTAAAAEYFGELTRRQPTAQNFAIKARVEHSLRNLDQAIADAGRALEIDADCVMALVFRASAYVLQKEFDLAEADITRALRIDPESYLAFSVQFNLLEKTNRKDEALASVARAIEINPHRALLFANQGAVLLQLGKTDEAVASFQRAIDVEPASNYGYYYMGYHQYRLKEFEQAKASLEKSAALNPRHYWTQYYLFMLAKLERDEVRYVRHLQLACDAKDGTSSARNLYAWALATSNRSELRNGAKALEIARELVEETDERNSMRLRYLKTLAAAQAELGRFDEAITTLDQIDSRRFRDVEIGQMYDDFDQGHAFRTGDF